MNVNDGKSVLVAMSCLSLSLWAGNAASQDSKPVGEFGWFGVGKAHEVEKGHYYWVGEFSGTFFSDKGVGSLFHKSGVKCPAYFDLDLSGPRHTAGGYCTLADADGDQAYLKWELKGDGRKGAGSFTFTGGTGKYSSIRGTNALTTAIQVNWADGTTSGFASWNK